MSLLLAVLWACSTPPPPPEPRPLGPSVLIVTLDTTRADRLGVYGYSAAHTPTLDRLASQGLRFDRAYATAALTIPSHSSIFTGRYPPSHGVRDNGDFVLGDEAITLAERFEEAGWSTAAFTAAFPTQARWGLDQGFRIYHDPLEGLPDQLDWSNERPAAQVVDDALDTLPSLAGPVFVWVHLFDPHWPYAPPEPWRSQLADPYDGEIAYADHELERLLRSWDRWFPNSVVVVTADHGEGHGDGGEETHGFLLHDATIRVPLLLRGPGVEPAAILDPVSHVDIVPTVLSLAGLSLHDGLQGLDLRTGGSDRPYQEALAGRYHLGLAELTAYTSDEGRLTRGGWDGFYPEEGGVVGLVPQRDGLSRYARGLDQVVAGLEVQEETRAGLASAELEQLRALGYVGGDISQAGTVDPRDVIDVIPRSWEARRAIAEGRLGAASQHLAVLEEAMPNTYGVRLLRAHWLVATGRSDEAVELLTELQLESPGSAVALQLASLAETRGDLRGAEDWYRTALEHSVRSPEALLGLVRVAWMRGEQSEARTRADEALQLYPDHAEVGLLRAELFLGDHRLDEALADAQDAARMMPTDPRALALLARIQWERGRAERAIELIGEAVRLDPAAVPPRVLMCDWLLEVGRSSEALRVVEPLQSLSVDWPDVQRLAAEASAAVEAEQRWSHRPR